MARLPDLEGLAIFAKVAEAVLRGRRRRAQAFQGHRFKGHQPDRGAARRAADQPHITAAGAPTLGGRPQRRAGSASVFLESVLMVGGGVPIKVGDEIVGAIGVSGSPGSVCDEECAEARIAKIAASLN